MKAAKNKLPQTQPQFTADLGPMIHRWRHARRLAHNGRAYRALISFGRFHTGLVPTPALTPKAYGDQLKDFELPPGDIRRVGWLVARPDVATKFLRHEFSFAVALQEVRPPVSAAPVADPETKRPQAAPAGRPNFFRWRLQQLLQQLAEEAPEESLPGTYRCGLLNLHLAAPSVVTNGLYPRPLKSPSPILKVSLASATVTQLDFWAGRSGLTRGQAAALLLARMPYEDLVAKFPNPAGAGKIPTRVPVYQLQRRKSRCRAIANAVGVPVLLSEVTRESLDHLAACCGLSAAATARLLLEPRAAAQVAAISLNRTLTYVDRFTTRPFADLAVEGPPKI